MTLYYHKLLYLLPIALITGPFLPDLIVVTCSILFLIDTFRYKLFSYYNNEFFKFFLIFFILINLSSLFSDNLISFKYSLSYIRYGVFSIFLFFILKKFPNFKFNFSLIIIFVFSFLILDGFIQYFFGKNLFFFNLENYQTGLPFVTSVFEEEKKLGSFLSRLSPILFISILFIREKYKFKLELIIIILIFLIFSLTLLTTERIAIFIITSFIILLSLKSNYFIFSKKIFLTSFFLLIIFIFNFNPELLEKIKSVFYSTGILFPGYVDENQTIVRGGYEQGLFFFSKFYHDQIVNSYNLFKENIFFGVGAKNYKLFVTDGWHPHNYHAQILSEFGIFSYIIFILVFISISFKLIKILFFEKIINPNYEMKFYIYCILFLNLLPIPNGDFLNNWLNIILYLPIGFLLFLNEKKI